MTNLKKISIVLLGLATGMFSEAKNLKVAYEPFDSLVWNEGETAQLTFVITDSLSNGEESDIDMEITVRGDRTDSPVYYRKVVKSPICGSEGLTVKANTGISEPGFYRVSVKEAGDEICAFNIGIAPEKVVSRPDAPSDFDEFWEKALRELSAVPLNATMRELPERSSTNRKMYFCQYLSLDNDTVSGYLALPTSPGKHPAIIYYNGYNGEPWDIDPDGMPDWIEFQHWVRGQGPNKPYNRYGDYIQYNLDDPEKFYYRGGYLDAVRTIDFIASLPETDPENIFAEGGSQGGAFTFVAAALDPAQRLRAIAPYIPFMSDFRDYFEIVSWPGDVVKAKASEIGLEPEKMYENLRYFDVKNFTPRIKVPVLMGVGLQDPTCPPHTNFAGYNNLPSDTPKEYIIYPHAGHTVDYSDWNPRRASFFNLHLAPNK